MPRNNDGRRGAEYRPQFLHPEDERMLRWREVQRNLEQATIPTQVFTTEEPATVENAYVHRYDATWVNATATAVDTNITIPYTQGFIHDDLVEQIQRILRGENNPEPDTTLEKEIRDLKTMGYRKG
jgi:hypothetical protein